MKNDNITNCDRFEKETNDRSCDVLLNSTYYQYCFVASYNDLQSNFADSLKKFNITTLNLTFSASTDEFKLNCNKWHDRLRTCIILWDLLFCILIHSIAIIVALIALFKHKIGRFYSFLLVISSMVQPVTVAVLTAYIIGEVANQIEPVQTAVDLKTGEEDCTIRDYSTSTKNAPIYSLIVALILNGLMILSSFFTRRNMRFV